MAFEEQTAIEALLPHREPFLFVTRIVRGTESAITTEWDVPADLDVFRGHFPGEPVLPGVLISEFVFQSGALLIYGASEDDREAQGIPVLTRIQDARFKRIVRPGETLRAEVEITERLANARFLAAKVTCQGQNVLRMRCALAVAEKAAGERP